VSTDFSSTSPPGRAPSARACEPYRELIAEALDRGRNAMAIWQDLVDDHGLAARDASVRRFVVALRGRPPVDARVVITTPMGHAEKTGFSSTGTSRPASVIPPARWTTLILTSIRR
jgi:hypothetical protein